MTRSKIARTKTSPDDFIKALELVKEMAAPDLPGVLGAGCAASAERIDELVKGYMIDRVSMQGISAVKPSEGAQKYSKDHSAYP